MKIALVDWMNLVGVLVWPATVSLAIALFRKPLTKFLEGLGQRVKKLSIFDFALELSTIPEFTTTWSAPNLSDVRQLSPAAEFSSQATALLDQIRSDIASDYAVIDTGAGQQWLTSRLFIFAILLQRMRGLQCFVFLETAGATRRRFIGIASPDGVRWGLARRYPWFEEAFARVYSQLQNYQPQSNFGALDTFQATQLVQGFLNQIQQTVPPVGDPTEWTTLASGTQQYWEHAKWLDGARLERVLHDVLQLSSMLEAPDSAPDERVKAALRRQGAFVALIEGDGRFKSLTDRQALLEALATSFVATSEGRQST